MAQELVLQAGAKLRAIIPTTFEECQRIANMAIRAGMFQIKGADDTARQAYATMALMQGAEIGMAPMMSLQNIAVINGNCRIWGKAVPALIRAHGHKIKKWYDGEPFKDDWTAKVVITRGDTGEEIEGSFSWAQAKRAGLTGKDGPWKLYPDRMMYWRAIGFACTDGTPEVLCGMYIREEIDDEERFDQARDVTPAKAAPEALAPPPAPEEEPQISPDEVSHDAPEQITPEGMISHLGSSLCAASTEDQVDEIWNEHMEEVCALGHGDRAKADELYERHMDRVKGMKDAA